MNYNLYRVIAHGSNVKGYSLHKGAKIAAPPEEKGEWVCFRDYRNNWNGEKWTVESADGWHTTIDDALEVFKKQASLEYQYELERLDALK